MDKKQEQKIKKITQEKETHFEKEVLDALLEGTSTSVFRVSSEQDSQYENEIYLGSDCEEVAIVGEEVTLTDAVDETVPTSKIKISDYTNNKNKYLTNKKIIDVKDQDFMSPGVKKNKGRAEAPCKLIPLPTPRKVLTIVRKEKSVKDLFGGKSDSILEDKSDNGMKKNIGKSLEKKEISENVIRDPDCIPSCKNINVPKAKGIEILKGENKFVSRRYGKPRSNKSEDEGEFDSSTETESSDEERSTDGLREHDFMIDPMEKRFGKTVPKPKRKKGVKGKLKDNESQETETVYEKNFEFIEKTGKYRCVICKKTYKKVDTVQAHRLVECSPNPQHQCLFCPYRGRNQTIVRVHIGKKHGKWPRLDSRGFWIY